MGQTNTPNPRVPATVNAPMMPSAQPQGANRFRLILRESGMAKTMGGDDMALGVQMADSIFVKALDQGASDIHLQPERAAMRVRIRVDGVLHSIGTLDHEFARMVLSRIKLAAGMRIDDKRLSQDGRLDMEYMGRRFSSRVSVMPSLNGEKLVARLFDPASIQLDVAQLGMPQDILGHWQRAIGTPYGMIIVTGPTGSGKTSTLYAAINQMDRLTRNIVTVEDPIEYEYADNITQVQVTERMTFPKVMRSFLRQDPDVMLVGEMRDPESLGIGIQASLTGHLVLTTLHTNNAVETIGRMVDMQAEPYLIASTVICILAQRLVRRTCQQCREPYRPTEEELLAMGFSLDEGAKRQFWKGKGCPACRNTGYRGRLGVFEMLLNTHRMKELIARRASSLELLRAARAQGMRTMMQDGVDKVLRGVTTPEEVIRAVYTSAALDAAEEAEAAEMAALPAPDGADTDEDGEE
jgi:type II secretory ATPase GspE/PulE/Tfp pilus assembly ATPase PilB-like protein